VRHLRARLIALASGALLASQPQAPATTADLDALLENPVLARALVGVRIESLRTGQVLYERNGARHVVPASNMKLVTLAVAAERLGWDFQYETRLEALGTIQDGVLHGDLVVVGSGDPSIGSQDAGPSPLFALWVEALRRAGIRRVDGRVIGDDNAFDDEGRGAGWSWDYLTAGYAAPAGALSYNENVAVVRASPGAAEGLPGSVTVTPPGSLFELVNEVTTGAADSRATLSVSRVAGERRLTVRGRVPAAGGEIVRTTSIDHPTRFFVQGLTDTLAAYGVRVTGGAWDIDDLPEPLAESGRAVVARHLSPPLSVLAGHLMKVSQNFYAETLLRTIGRAADGTGSDDSGRRAVRETLASWDIPADALVVYDGSGLSRYNYVTANAMVSILARMWTDERHRGPFVASLPVGGHDGTLASRMRDPVLARRVQAKTGTIANVRALSGFLDTASGDKLVFSIIANHFTAASREIDEIVEEMLRRILSGFQVPGAGFRVRGFRVPGSRVPGSGFLGFRVPGSPVPGSPVPGFQVPCSGSEGLESGFSVARREASVSLLARPHRELWLSRGS
jgi:D-alanyl-D-alanine carboxypeptidase/D-alanyl-D-alanine-endopeptidase (penicillin-binding protein 4)